MSPVSRWPLTKDEEEKVRDLFLGRLVEITEKDKMRSLLKSLLSESEYLMVAKRLVAFVLVDEGYTDVEAAKILHVTRATANRFRIIYKFSREKKEPVVQVVREFKRKPEFKYILLKVLVKHVLPAAMGRIPKRWPF